MGKEYFVDGLGYLFYKPFNGWYVRRTPDGKIGGSFKAEYAGWISSDVLVKYFWHEKSIIESGCPSFSHLVDEED